MNHVTEQSLFDPVGDTIASRFERFHAAHPEVYAMFVKFARQAKAAGRERFSADAILHRVRWETLVNPQKDESYRVNDHFSSRYARKLIQEDASFAGFFELRKLHAA